MNQGYDFAYIHVEAPDEMGHQGLVKEKIQAIENIDRYVVGTLVEMLKKAGESYRILVLPDHPTPIRVRTHTSSPIPYMLYDSTKKLGIHHCYSEKAGEESGILKENGYELIDYLLQI